MLKINYNAFQHSKVKGRWYPFYFKLPNVRKVQVTRNAYHKFLSYFGIVSYKDQRDVKLKRLDRGNRYLGYVELRLTKLSLERNSKTYFKFATTLLQNKLMFI